MKTYVRGTRRIKTDGEKGFTLIELMTATLVFLVAVGVVLGMLARNEEARTESYQVLESRQSARSALDFLVSEIRMAGSGVGLPVVTSTASGDSVTLYPVNPDSVGGRAEKLALLGQFTDVATNLTQAMNQPYSQLTVYDTTGFEAGDLVVVTYGAFANLFQITGIEGQIFHHGTGSPYNQPAGHGHWPPGGYPTNSRVVKMDLVTYYVDRSDSCNARIVRQEGADDPRTISDYIDSFELQYELRDHTVVSFPPDPTLIQAVIVSVEASSDETCRGSTTRLVSAAKPRCW